MGRISVQNGGPSGEGESMANCRSKEDRNRYAGSRQKEECNMNARSRGYQIGKMKTLDCRKCAICFKVEPAVDFPQRAPESGKRARFECRDSRGVSG